MHYICNNQTKKLIMHTFIFILRYNEVPPDENLGQNTLLNAKAARIKKNMPLIRYIKTMGMR